MYDEKIDASLKKELEKAVRKSICGKNGTGGQKTT